MLITSPFVGAIGDGLRIERQGFDHLAPAAGIAHRRAVEIDLDGQAMGFAGKDGGMAEGLILDPQSIVDRSSGARP